MRLVCRSLFPQENEIFVFEYRTGGSCPHQKAGSWGVGCVVGGVDFSRTKNMSGELGMKGLGDPGSVLRVGVSIGGVKVRGAAASRLPQD